ncbi:(2Fe-2S)-binding protein [Streptomyces sp. NBC_00234]|uniref:(2Fe-2S)-binding protein n=1 Tax=Streptomyces sp. NBC_00234 TaxID=2903638 RepID=UPI002E2977EB|nr:(2Fe-2S)-binding protein [Streptomyces sp. NBC_00234]
MDRTEPSMPGGFFALRTDAVPGGAHRPLADLYAGDLGPLTARVDTVAARLRTPERRVAASIAQLGLAARLWSVALGHAALFGRLPDLSPDRFFWDPAHTSPDDLWLSGTDTLPGTAEGIREAVQFGHLVPLAAAMRAEGTISERLLWGNAGSALGGAVRELATWARAHGRPEAAERARTLAAELFGHPDLRSTGTPHGPAFRRRSCCLYYRCPDGGLCGDCVFDRRPGAAKGVAPG